LKEKIDMDIRLTEYTKFSGCGAKLGPGLLDKALCGLVQPNYPELIVGYAASDDAGVFRLNDELALVQTIDFFPPIVDDPITFGKIAAANALSDIYSMGGKPLTAVSVVLFPQSKMNIEVLRKVMEGGLISLIDAGVALVGGHSIEDDEIKFGFSISGIINPKRIMRNNTIEQNEILILSKPLGTGLINTALRAGMASDTSLKKSIEEMTRLNRIASEIALSANASACTDVTGFGLLGHAAEMVCGSSAGLTIHFSEIPLIDGAIEYARLGLIPAGTYRNREFREKMVNGLSTLPTFAGDILFDPQTSGGLLFSVSKERYQEVLVRLKETGHTANAIGETTNEIGVIRVEL